MDFAGRETTFGHAISVKCDLGYALKGDTTITCQADGTWSKNTFCIIKSKLYSSSSSVISNMTLGTPRNGHGKCLIFR